MGYVRDDGRAKLRLRLFDPTVDVSSLFVGEIPLFVLTFEAFT